MKFLGEVGKRPFKAGKHIEKKVVTEVKPLTRVEKRKVFAIVLVSIFSIVFWVFWYLTYLAVYDYGGQFVNMSVGGFAVPLSWFDSLNSFVCIAMGPVLGLIWFKLSKRPKGDMSLFKKLAMGLSLLGMSFLMLVGAEISRGIGAGATSKASIIWIIAFGVLLSMGEMLFSPLGNSFVTKHAPNKIYSILMGVWIFVTFVAGKSYSYLYKFASQFPIIQSYVVIPIILFVCAALLFIFDKKLGKLLEEEEPAENQSLSIIGLFSKTKKMATVLYRVIFFLSFCLLAVRVFI